MADIFLWASLILRGCKAVSVNTVCVDYRIHQQQLSSVLNVKAGPRSVHEAFLVADLLDSCSDIELIRGLWADQKHLKNPDGWCQCDIPFINAYNMANSHIYSYFYWGCVRLNQLLNSPVRARLWEQYGFGIKEHSVFLEVNLDNIVKSFGMNVNVVTTAKTKEETLYLLKKINLPIK